MALLAERAFGAIGLADVAARAGVSLAVLRDNYDNKLGILADFSRRIDRSVMEGGIPGEGETRDRLLEVMMRRFDALASHRSAIMRLAETARFDFSLARGLYRIAARSQMWMLVTANLHYPGLLGRVAVHGALLVYLEAMNAWFGDDDPGLARTMATLDRALRRGETAMNLLGDLCRMLPGFSRRPRERRSGARRAG
jgi:AcrR family transcriptional regulator